MFELLITAKEHKILANNGIDFEITYGIPGISTEFGISFDNLDEYEEAVVILNRPEMSII